MALETLPESLSRLSPSLTALHINTNSLSSMPEIELKAVQTLVIRYNQLVSLPTSLGTFAALVTLDASNNSLESLPESMFDIYRRAQIQAVQPAQQVLWVCGCLPVRAQPPRYSRLAVSSGALPMLQSIDVNTNRLTSLPETIGRLPSLRTLTAHTNKLEALPEALGALPSLRTLDVAHNALASLPESVGYLHACVEINVAHNALAALPPSIGQMRSLQRLLVSHNPPLRLLPTAVCPIPCVPRPHLVD